MLHVVSSRAPRPRVGLGRRSRSTARTAATWCGTVAQADRVPNGVAGNPIHWVYVIPSDGGDNLTGLASVMQIDAE